MNSQKIGVAFTLKFENVTDLNPSFATARVAIAYHGRNRNRSSISKESFEKAIPSLFNCPLVGRYDEDIDDFGSHDIRVKKNSDGEYEIVNATVPFGVIPSQSNVTWETIAEEDGTQREYLFTDVILWKRQYGYERLAKQDTWSQSMEIAVNSFMVDPDGYCVIDDFTFEALTILGNSVEPCFESASVQLNAQSTPVNYKAQFSQMMDELRNLAMERPEKFGLVIKNEEGENTLNDEKMNENFGESQYPTGNAVPASESDKQSFTDEKSFSSTYRQKRDALNNALKPVYGKDSAGNVISETYLWLSDFDEAYVYVEKCTWTADRCVETYGRMAYVFDESSMKASITGEFEEMVQQWLTLEENVKLQQSRSAFETLTNEFEQYKDVYKTAESEVDELREFKEKAMDLAHKAEINCVLEEFEEKLGNNELFTALKANDREKAYEYKNAEDLRNYCFMIVGKTSFAAFSRKPSGTVKIPVKDSSVDKDEGRYGDLFERFGK